MPAKYFPTVSQISKALKVQNGVIAGEKKTLVSLEMLRVLIQLALDGMDFDEKLYLEENPDLATAWKKKEITNLKEHFISTGYFEGRRIPGIKFDERWYLKKYKDVEVALKNGSIKNPRHHYETVGEKEGRAPNSDAVAEMEIWAKLFAVK